MFPGPAHMPHLRPGIRPAKEKAAPIKIGTAMMNDTLRCAVVDTDEFGKIGKADDEIFGRVVKPIGAAAPEHRVIAPRIAMLLKLDRRYERLPFECDQRMIEAVDDPASHVPCAEIGFQPVDCGRSYYQDAARCAEPVSACLTGSFQPGLTKWHV